MLRIDGRDVSFASRARAQAVAMQWANLEAVRAAQDPK
jgi:hypothetical protein